jgi:MoaA/NifB/PqqE/SkfB family radical SAM enzyme
MKSELRGIMKRQYDNYRVFKAYSVQTLLKEALLFPRDILTPGGRSSNVLNLALFVTLRCNARCAMCNLSDILNKNSLTDMPPDKMGRFLDDVKRYHPGIILFGGEPFIRKDIVELIRMVKSRGLSVGTFTNGTLLNEDIIDGIIGAGLDWIAFSLQGTRDVHDRILGSAGAFEKMVGNISVLTKKRPRKTRVVIHSTICEHNVNDLRDLAVLGLDLGADLVRFGHPTFYSQREALSCTDALRKGLGDDHVKALSYIYDIRGKEDLYVSNITKIRSEFGNRISFSPDLGADELRRWYSPDFSSGRKCLFAWRGAFVYPNGDMYPCESIAYNVGNVFDNNFDDVWNGDRYKKMRQLLKKRLFSACARCCKL